MAYMILEWIPSSRCCLHDIRHRMPPTAPGIRPTRYLESREAPGQTMPEGTPPNITTTTLCCALLAGTTTMQARASNPQDTPLFGRQHARTHAV